MSALPLEQPKGSTGNLIEGLDDIFDLSTGTESEVPGNSQGTPATQEYASGTAHWLTVEEAAKSLRISPNAVIKRLGKGKLTGKKVAGQFGEKWLVDPAALPQAIHVDLGDMWTDGTAEQVPGNSSSTGSMGQEQPGYSENLTRKSLEVFANVISQQTEQIRIQNSLIQQLTEQVKDKDLQVKLLTDSQHSNRSWWSKFSSWFMGRS